MSLSTVLLINLSVLAAILFSDLGSRAVTWHRLARPLIISALIVPSFLHALSTHGNDLTLELGGIGAGILVAVLAVSLMNVRHTPSDSAPRTQAGFGYAAVWSTVTAARIAFVYGAQHWFGAWLGQHAARLHLTATGISNALIYMAIATAISRTFVLWGRVAWNRRVSGGAPIPVSSRARLRPMPAV